MMPLAQGCFSNQHCDSLNSIFNIEGNNILFFVASIKICCIVRPFTDLNLMDIFIIISLVPLHLTILILWFSIIHAWFCVVALIVTPTCDITGIVSLCVMSWSICTTYTSHEFTPTMSHHLPQYLHNSCPLLSTTLLSLHWRVSGN